MNEAKKRLNLYSIFSDIRTGDFHASSQLDIGGIPLISCKTEKTPDHGVEGYFEIPQNKTYKNCVTITCDGDQPSTALYHPFRFAAKDNVLVCIPKPEVKLTTILYAIACLNMERWRFSYGRKCYSNKIEKLTVPFYLKADGSIDEEAVEKVVSCESMEPIVKIALTKLVKEHKQGIEAPKKKMDTDVK
jgi:type I restriction enzyme M protein